MGLLSVKCWAIHKYTKKDVNALPITRHDFHGDWHYTISPQPDTP